MNERLGGLGAPPAKRWPCRKRQEKLSDLAFAVYGSSVIVLIVSIIQSAKHCGFLQSWTMLSEWFLIVEDCIIKKRVVEEMEVPWRGEHVGIVPAKMMLR